ncbi:hypothetical protein JCM11641_007003 [Rhodosporidiobolus odoratus]
MDTIQTITTEEQLVAFLANSLPLLPKGFNPYVYLRQQVDSVGGGAQPASTVPLLIAGIVADGILVLLFLILFFLRMRNRAFWLARVVNVDRGRGYLLFHYQNAWCIPVVLMLATLQILMTLGGVISMILATWTLTTTYILHRRTYATKGAVPFYFSSPFITIAFLSLTAAYIAISCYFGSRADWFWRNFIDSFLTTEARLIRAAQEYSGTIETDDLRAVAPSMLAMVRDLDRLIFWYRGAFLVNGAVAIAFLFYFAIISLVYIAALRQSLREFAGKSTTGVAMFQKSLRGLIAVTTSFAFFIPVLAADAFWVAFSARKIIASPSSVYTELSFIIPIFTCIFASTLAVLLMLYQTLSKQAPKSPETACAPGPATSLPTSTSYAQLAHHYTHFALAASEPLPSLAYLSAAAGSTKLDLAAPFEDLELAVVGDEQSEGKHGFNVNVSRQEVTVVTLAREPSRQSFEAEAEEDRGLKWYN